MQRLRLIWAAMLVSLPIYALIVVLAGASGEAPHSRGLALIWVLGLVAAANLVTVAPLLGAMLASARRTFAAEPRPEALLASHLGALVVAWARVEAVAILGLVAFFVSGRPDVFWAFLGVSAAGLLLLRPTPGNLEELLAGSTPAPLQPIEP